MKNLRLISIIAALAFAAAACTPGAQILFLKVMKNLEQSKADGSKDELLRIIRENNSRIKEGGQREAEFYKFIGES